MKKNILLSSVISLFALVLLFSCSKNNPTTPEPTETPTVYLSATITPTSTDSPTQSMTPTVTSTASDSPTFTVSPTSTATATATNTPEHPTISGNLVLPSPHQGVVWEVIVDTDMNFNNGIINMAMGTCGSSSNVPYSVTAPAGTYYMYALVKTVGVLTSPPIAGDYLGWYGATYPDNPSEASAVFTADSELSGQDMTMVLAQNNVAGTLTLPANAEGKQMLLAIHPTTDPSEGVFYLALENISGSTGTTLPYQALCYMPGTFYITVQISSNGNTLPRAPIAGDYVGQLSPPAVMEPENDNQPLNITLYTY
ncbi:MAG: hypothetical protein LLG37_03920 [Spirochaetia bacterium]|nr:hypothetical protein [Spirochaetia bacterium]